MAYDYSRMVSTATRLISKYGRSMTLRSTTETGDPWNPTQTNSDTAITGTVVDYKSSEIDGDAIQTNDKRILIDSTAVPTLQDKVVDGSVEYSIIDIREIKPGSTVVLYDLQVRI